MKIDHTRIACHIAEIDTVWQSTKEREWEMEENKNG